MLHEFEVFESLISYTKFTSMLLVITRVISYFNILELKATFG